ncbi:hypothetical protein IAQ61_007884 [Plenodomus lingam]|uniref:uncharacterized protein n=1 Tax=Leptosphaeria maculans TaxID=5022 RepID=UPI003325B45A|nr:hypothetical protein IAQ61_007884 [Plenodomus lingam]
MSQQTQSSGGDLRGIGGKVPKNEADQWSNVMDPNERRKIQNKLAQRRYRDKTKENKEESERQAENQRNAGSSYTSPEPEAMQSNETLSGLPWGGINMKHIIETGKRKELGSKQTSQANSLHGGATGGRLGLDLSHQFARGSPAWQYLRHFSYNQDARATW